MKKFLEDHPDVGAHFHTDMKESENLSDDILDNEKDIFTRMHELHPKSVSQAVFNFEVYKEMCDRKEVSLSNTRTLQGQQWINN